MFTKAFTYPLYESLGIFIPLIVVNCIILGRAEAFAKKNGVMLSLADGLGMGLGFTISLAVLGAIREFFGAGTLGILGVLPGGLGEKLGEMQFIDQPFDFLQQAPGAFVALGLMLGIMNVVGRLTRR
jgi:electron transport complex protein RnfE